MKHVYRILANAAIRVFSSNYLFLYASLRGQATTSDNQARTSEKQATVFSVAKTPAFLKVSLHSEPREADDGSPSKKREDAHPSDPRGEEAL